MTEEEMETARAFVACPRWVWLPGMRADCGYRLVRKDGSLWWVARWDEARLSCISLRASIPDITDPATLGCIRHIVVDVLGIVDWDLTQAGSAGWYFGFVTLGGDDFDFWGNTEAEPLLRALQAAPEVKNE